MSSGKFQNTSTPQQRGDAMKKWGGNMLVTYVKRFCLLLALGYSMKEVPPGYSVILSNHKVLNRDGTLMLRAAQCCRPVVEGEKSASLCESRDGTLRLVAFNGTPKGLKIAFKMSCTKKLSGFGWNATYIPNTVE